MATYTTLHDADTGTPVYHIVLRDTEGYEPEPVSSRRFTLLLGSTFPIGRASRNTTKAELMPAEHNAFIDSPVISRDHAVLSAIGDEDAPQMFVTDSKSMHGTFVNGERLEAHTPKQLKSGDILQFGVDVNRNEGTHLRKFSDSLLALASADFIFPRVFHCTQIHLRGNPHAATGALLAGLPSARQRWRGHSWYKSPSRLTVPTTHNTRLRL
jgi:hypothetical protein